MDSHFSGPVFTPSMGAIVSQRAIRVTHEHATGIYPLLQVGGASELDPKLVEVFCNVATAMDATGVSVAVQHHSTDDAAGTDILASSAITLTTLGWYPALNGTARYLATSNKFINVNFTKGSNGTTGEVWIFVRVTGIGKGANVGTASNS